MNCLVLCTVVLAVATLSVADDGPKCPEHQTTVYRVPYLGDCTKYWECYQGAKYVQTCPKGLEFNAPLMQCDIPEIAKCDHSKDTTPSTGPTTQAPSTTSSQWKPDPLCPYPSDDIVYFNYPGDCNKFYECYQGNKYVKQCPKGLYWNQPISRCDYPENVPNCDITSSTPESPNTSSKPTAAPPATSTNQPWKPDPVCPYPSDELVFFPYPGDCNKFYECYQGNKYEQHCQPDLWWNQAKQQCDYKQNVKDCKM